MRERQMQRRFGQPLPVQSSPEEGAQQSQHRACPLKAWAQQCSVQQLLVLEVQPVPAYVLRAVSARAAAQFVLVQ